LPLQRAEQLADWLAENKYDSLRTHFSPELKSRLNAEQMQMVWLGLYNQFGALTFVGKPAYRQLGVHPEITIPLRFEKQQQRLLLGFDSLSRINTFVLQAATEEENWRYPSYGRTNSYREFSMRVKTDTVQLPAILTLPNGCKKCPVVIMVHGAGPNDKDESQGPNKMFRDLAIGLASRGIASLRYDKRSFSYGPELMEDLRRLTIQTETINDAVSALTLLRQVRETDSNRIFLLGHGIGAMLAPAIVQQSPVPVKSLLLVAPAAKPFAELVFEQYVYLAAESGISAAEQHMLKKQENAKKRALDTSLQTGFPQDSLPLSLPAEYWLSWQRYDPGAGYWQINQPLFVASGGADYQVPPETLLHFKQKMMGRDRISYFEYPLLNHFMMPGSGAPGPKDYQRRNNVSEQLINDLEKYIKTLK